jgi:cell division transport system permease protein
MSLPLVYFGREALRQAWRQRLLSLVAVSALGLAALSAGAWALLLRNASHWHEALGQQLELVAYLKPGLSPGAQDLALGQAKALSGAASAQLVTADDAKAQLARDPDLKAAFDTLGENPLSASLRVKVDAQSPAALKAFAASLGAVAGVDSVDSGGGALDSMLKVAGTAQAALLALGCLLSAAALLIVAAGVRLAAHSRRTELGILRLVGASHAFIRTPFILEGAGLGALAGAVAALALALMQTWLSARLLSDLQVDLTAFWPQGMDASLALELVAGMALLGGLGAALAVSTLTLAYEDEEA